MDYGRISVWSNGSLVSGLMLPLSGLWCLFRGYLGGAFFVGTSTYRTMRMSEPPFRPREKLYEKQKMFQSIHKHTYLKGPYDKITSVAIPAALAATSLFLIARGIYNMSHGIGKKEDAA